METFSTSFCQHRRPSHSSQTSFIFPLNGCNFVSYVLQRIFYGQESEPTLEIKPLCYIFITCSDLPNRKRGVFIPTKWIFFWRRVIWLLMSSLNGRVNLQGNLSMMHLMSLVKAKWDSLCVEVESSSLYLVCFVVFRLAVCDFFSLSSGCCFWFKMTWKQFSDSREENWTMPQFWKGFGEVFEFVGGEVVLFNFKDIQGKIMKRVQLFLHKADSVPLHISLCLSFSFL